ncbi:hypothetical protein [Rugamonas sp. DEMB1]|uniref:hypothetical protein n=1 Tax=Rugamonas sp. DEMB1 TaxID=3039386 RepID=UPI002447EECA|nr:hypothetical protein [Rugamonas sp. DEMB1]WGG48406.1 hypothetical protein QC826_17010 [Rugamonas sp. DEMB1]
MEKHNPHAHYLCECTRLLDMQTFQSTLIMIYDQTRRKAKTPAWRLRPAAAGEPQA